MLYKCGLLLSPHTLSVQSSCSVTESRYAACLGVPPLWDPYILTPSGPKDKPCVIPTAPSLCTKVAAGL